MPGGAPPSWCILSPIFFFLFLRVGANALQGTVRLAEFTGQHAVLLALRGEAPGDVIPTLSVKGNTTRETKKIKRIWSSMYFRFEVPMYTFSVMEGTKRLLYLASSLTYQASEHQDGGDESDGGGAEDDARYHEARHLFCFVFFSKPTPTTAKTVREGERERMGFREEVSPGD